MSLKVWWIPQIPGSSFEVEVETVAEGAKLMNTLADYDRFQFENGIKPDYCNTGGLSMLQGTEWVDWCDEKSGEDDPYSWLAQQGQCVDGAPYCSYGHKTKADCNCPPIADNE